MPDLGKYALEVTVAYGGSFAILGALVLLTLRQSRRTRHALDQIEDRQNDG